MKQCFKCLQTLPLNMFYKHAQMSDGHLNKCKECAKVDVQENYCANKNHYQDYEKKRSRLPHRRELQKKITKRYRSKHPNLTSLCNKIPPRPCEVCGSNKIVHRHHDDYSKPLQVRFLCPLHHKEAHKKP